VEDQAVKRQALENYSKQFGSPVSTVKTFNFDDLVDPRDTRPLAIRALRTARAGNTASLGPKVRHGIMP